MPRAQPEKPLHQRLLESPEGLEEAYDRSAQEFIEVGRMEGHYEGWASDDLIWPGSDGEDATEDVLRHRLKLVRRLEEGIPGRRAVRLKEAHEDFVEL